MQVYHMTYLDKNLIQDSFTHLSSKLPMETEQAEFGGEEMLRQWWIPTDGGMEVAEKTCGSGGYGWW